MSMISSPVVAPLARAASSYYLRSENGASVCHRNAAGPVEGSAKCPVVYVISLRSSLERGAPLRQHRLICLGRMERIGSSMGRIVRWVVDRVVRAVNRGVLGVRVLAGFGRNVACQAPGPPCRLPPGHGIEPRAVAGALGRCGVPSLDPRSRLASPVLSVSGPWACRTQTCVECAFCQQGPVV